MIDAHMVGFEKEALFSSALMKCREAHDSFKAKTLKEALQLICPDFMKGLYDIRPCTRKLKFVGNDYDQFFKYGQTYESVDFNGGTYGIKGYDGRVGCGHFEVCKDGSV